MARQFNRGMKRKTQWASFGNAVGAAPMPTLALIGAGLTAVLSRNLVVAGATGLLEESFTITRMIGSLYMRIAEALNASVAIGCYMARLESIVAGIASLPNPITDPDASWLWYYATQIAGDLAADPVVEHRIQFDVHSQRIVDRGETLVWIASIQGDATSVGVAGRVLVKLT